MILGGGILALSRSKRPFWQVKPLAEMTAGEWESLCDGCGRCCTVKLEDEDTGEIHQTRLACKLLDIGSCRCKDYPSRHKKVHDCVALTPENVLSLKWLPRTCAYVLVAEGKPLQWWHHLVSGDPESVHAAGISVREVVRSETRIAEHNYERYIIPPLSDQAAGRSGLRKHGRK
ncbi:MAG: YcgN family cysteine cluster protein [Hyphomicrobiaceae bacterium]